MLYFYGILTIPTTLIPNPRSVTILGFDRENCARVGTDRLLFFHLILSQLIYLYWL